MNKAELRAAVQRELDCPATQADRAINAVFRSLTEGLQNDSNVQIMGFGSFQVKNRAARTLRNPSTGQTMSVPPSRTVLFRAGRALKETLEGGNGHAAAHGK